MTFLSELERLEKEAKEIPYLSGYLVTPNGVVITIKGWRGPINVVATKP